MACSTGTIERARNSGDARCNQFVLLARGPADGDTAPALVACAIVAALEAACAGEGKVTLMAPRCTQCNRLVRKDDADEQGRCLACQYQAEHPEEARRERAMSRKSGAQRR